MIITRFATATALLVALLLVLSTDKAVADVPAHCLKWQVLGVWDFKMSAPQDGSPLCSHTRPDDIVTPYKLKAGYDNPGFDVASTGNFTLLSNYSDAAILCLGSSCESAKWTMVYDEAMVVKGDTSGLQLLFFFVYVPRVDNGIVPETDAVYWKTFCDRTYPGWYGRTLSERGCVVAKNRVTMAAQPSMNIWEPLITAPPASSANLLQVSIKTKLKQSLASTALNSRAFDLAKLEESVALINKRQKLWVADASAASFAENFNLGDALRSVGGIRQKLLKPKSFSLDDIRDPVLKAKEALRRQCIRKVLPDALDWSTDPYAKTPVLNQGSCGSCYAVSSADAFTSRLRLKKQSQTFVPRSAKHIVKCSVVNQACVGGFPWLVAYHGHYEGLVSDTCAGPYGPDMDVSCEANEAQCTADKEFVKSWGYVGGYYGRGNTEDMMWSLHRDGPMAVAINAASDLFVYRQGLFVATELENKDYAKIDEAYWVATTHAIVLVGYGIVDIEGEKVEYWRLKNSWGEGWGMKGYFDIQRGVDAMGVESMPVHAIFGDGKPGNPNFESSVRSKLDALKSSGDDSCSEPIEAMLQKELV